MGDYLLVFISTVQKTYVKLHNNSEQNNRKMKFIKEIPNDFCKASLYAWNNKFIIKFEAGMYEQTYKVNEYDVAGEDEIEEMIGDSFMEKVVNRFKEMSEDFENILDSVD